MPRRMRLPRIEVKPKDVHESDSFCIRADIKRKESLALALVGIRRAIIEGEPLPAGSYRSKISTTHDELLESHGIMHLHLGHAGTSELLYLVQYPEYVVFLEVNNHIHLDEKPPGLMLLRDHKKKLAATATSVDSTLEAVKEANVIELRSRLKGLVRPKTP